MDRLKHILSSRQFTLGFLINLFKDTILILELMKTREGRELLTHVLPGYVLGEMFWQESSRTYHSFAAAAVRLGMSTPPSERGVKKTRVKNGKKITKWELVFSSEAKDAYFEDEVRAWASCYDALVLRTAEEGLVARAAAILDEFDYDVSVINAGDGKGEHPTQTLIDLITLFVGLKLNPEMDWSRLKNHRVAFVNDCGSRTVNSLAWLLGVRFKMPLTFIASPGLEMSEHLREELKKENCNFVESNELLPADAFYVTRHQFEYGGEPKRGIVVDRRVADKYGVKVVMHPFPRSKNGNELPTWLPHKPETHKTSLDKDPRAFYFYQMAVGVPVRMSLLKYLLNPYLDLKKLKEEKLIRGIKNQCVICNKIEYHELGWTELAPKDGYLQGLPHIVCPKCQPKAATL